MTHVLLIDDDLNNLHVSEALLNEAGYSFTSIQDATQVQDALPEIGLIDLVLLDLEMPDIDGYQMFELLKSQRETNEIPIVACTVHTTELDTCREMGFDGLIAKPLDADQFIQQVNKILGGSPVWNAR